MTETKGKQKTEIKTRQPQKKTPDTFANLRQPHPVEELLGLSHPTLATPPTPLTPPTAAPARDFARVANSIARQAVPSGLFAGKSKQLYDFLYSKTRGAIVPKRSVRLTKTAIMQGSHIGSERTMYKNLKRLETTGLVQVRSIAGEQLGSEYTVLLPEEVAPLTPPTDTTHTSHTDQKVETPPTAESGVSGVSLNAEDSSISGDPKTSFKTKEENFDDEAAPPSNASKHRSNDQPERFEAFTTSIESMDSVVKELTGKGISPNDASKWSELFEVLIAELRIAAARTTVSNVPAFLSEHLRRRLWKMDRKQGIETPDQPSKASAKHPVTCACRGAGWVYPEGEGKGVAKCPGEPLEG